MNDFERNSGGLTASSQGERATVAVWPVVATRGRPEWVTRQLDRLVPQLTRGDGLVVVTDGDPRTDAAVGRWERRSEASENTEAEVVAVPLAMQMGPDRARRVGNAMVPTDAVVIEIDDHDLAEPGLVAAVRDVMGNPAVLVAYCDCWHTDPDGLARRRVDKRDGRFATIGNLGWGMRAYRKWAYDCVGGYPVGEDTDRDGQYWPANDYAMMCMLEQFGGPGCVHHIRTPLVTVIEDGTGISRTLHDQQQRQVERVANIALRRGFTLPWMFADQPVSPTADSRQPTARRHRIPQIIHFVWVGPDMPDYARRNIARFRRLNPDWRVMVHGEEVLLPVFRAGYDAITGEHQWARKSDLLRVSALRKFGGWYFDCDFLPLRPLADVVADTDLTCGCLLTRGTPELTANGIIAVAVTSPFLDTLVEGLTALAGDPVNQHWGAFGPQFYTELAAEHAADVVIGDMGAYYPVQDRAESQAAYLRLTAAGCSPEACRIEFGDARPYMMHMNMQDSLTVGEGVVV